MGEVGCITATNLFQYSGFFSRKNSGKWHGSCLCNIIDLVTGASKRRKRKVRRKKKLSNMSFIVTIPDALKHLRWSSKVITQPKGLGSK